ncbi:MAG TPA: NAD(P)/FAD-dependent oxidoreductase [Noviherbaspirillum sp.]|nr:NAD(P)/FAD-dependent oxidoreductase [Noviherbaspirillum sp.]
MNKYRIGIVGAGTAGLATAIAFARSGHAVEVFEKHPSLATLGAGVLIQPQGVAALADLGVGREFESISVPIDRLVGICHRGWKLVDIPYSDLQARAVSRSALGGVLKRACDSLGVRIHFSSPVERVGAVDDQGVLWVDGSPCLFDVIVIANGASSCLPADSGLAVRSALYQWGALWSLIDLDSWPDEKILGQRFRGTRQMYGIMPTERVGGKLRVSFFWSLPRNGFEQWRETPIDVWKKELLDLWPESAPVVEQIRTHDQFAFASYYHARPKRLAEPPVCIVGDAAHAMSPQLGLGSTLAVQDALALASRVDEFGPVDGLLRYSAGRLFAVRAYQFLSKALTPCFQADGNGLLRDLVFAGALWLPGTRYLMHRSIAAPRRCARRAWSEAI